MNIDEILHIAEESGIFEFMDSMNLQAQNNAVIAFANRVAAAVTNEPCVVLERGDVAMERYLKQMERMKAEGWRQCAVGQRTTQFCGQLEAAVAAEREACAKVCEMIAINACSRRASECAAAIRARGDK